MLRDIVIVGNICNRIKYQIKLHIDPSHDDVVHVVIDVVKLNTTQFLDQCLWHAEHEAFEV